MSELCKHDTFKDICGTCHRDAQITRLTEEMKRLRDVLKHYAGWEFNGMKFEPIDDGGALARAALSGDKQ